MDTTCAPLAVNLFSYCYDGFYDPSSQSKRFDPIEMFNDTSRYLDDSFTNDNPEFEKHIADIYPAELHWNKVNTLKTSFLD